MKELELLAPARNKATAIAAITYGADAVYIGADSHGARQAAGNSVADIAEVVRFAHRFGAKVYVTVNTIIYEHELKDVQQLIRDLYSAGVDALIVQDLGILAMQLPPIALHASTQCDIRTPGKARFLQECGMSQLVLPRELSLKQIREISDAVDVPLEGFVHGALCVSYSGDCQASHMLTGRSANRGECSQICRFRFDLEDASGRKLVRNKYLLSLKDMNRLARLGEMADAGISSFKIEGRLKGEEYVKNVVLAYRRALDALIEANPERYKRSSFGLTASSLTPDPAASFNRGFTDYFLDGGKPAPHTTASVDTPKSIGQPIGRVAAQLSPRKIAASLTVVPANGDGLGFFNERGEYEGVRLNRVENGVLHLAGEVKLRAGTTLYRNSSKQWNDAWENDRATRTIPVVATLRKAGDQLLLEGTVNGNVTVAVAEPADFQVAKTPQNEARLRVIGKMGDTAFRLQSLHDELGDMLFVPASQLTTLRRRLTQALEHTIEARHGYVLRKPAAVPRLPEGYRVTRHDNIANSLAASVYAVAAQTKAPLPRAAEVDAPAENDCRVMRCRYCLRRELGACLRTPDGSRFPEPLYLTSGPFRLRLNFDCSACEMEVHLCRRTSR